MRKVEHYTDGAYRMVRIGDGKPKTFWIGGILSASEHDFATLTSSLPGTHLIPDNPYHRDPRDPERPGPAGASVEEYQHQLRLDYTRICNEFAGPNDPLILAAHSLGCRLALQMSKDTDIRKKLCAVLFFAPPNPCSSAPEPQQRQASDTFFASVLNSHCPRMPDEIFYRMVKAHEGEYAGTKYWKKILQQECPRNDTRLLAEIMDDVRGMTVPMLALFPDKDPIGLQYDLDYGPNLEKKIIEGSGHFPHLDATDECLRHILSFGRNESLYDAGLC